MADDAVGDGQVHRARAENIDENAREPPAFVAGRLRIEFGGRAGRRLHVPVVENLLAVAIQASWRNAEQVLNADGEAHLFVVFHLAHAHEEIAVLIGVVHQEGWENVWLALDLEQRVLLGLADRVRILEFNMGRCVADGGDVPTTCKQLVFEFVAELAAVGAFKNADALCAERSKRRDRRAHDARVHPMRVARRVSRERGVAGQIDFDARPFSP